MAKRRNTDNIRIAPVKFMTKEQWDTANAIFRAQYKSDSPCYVLPYSKAKNYFELVHMYDGERMIGFMAIVDIDRMRESVLASVPGTSDLDYDFWKDPARTVNRRQIELLWIHPQYRGLGLATTFYKFALTRMGVTQIHIDGERVLPRMDYWIGLGFTKFFINIVGGDIPTLKLHIDTDSPVVYDLNPIHLRWAHDDREVSLRG